MRVSTPMPVADWSKVAPAAQQAEADGYDAVQSNELKHDPFIPLAFAAMATQRVQLATSVAISFPRSPMIVANLAYDLHRHSKGRYIVGLGTQVKPHIERRFSSVWSHPAARHCDSVRLHGFATRKYLETIVRPMLETELKAAGKTWENFEVTGGGFVATGPNEEEVAKQVEKLRYRVAFYGSTPAYFGVFETHGLHDLGPKLREATRRGAWGEMSAMISDDVLDLFIARATYDKLPEAIAKRFGGIVDTVAVEFLPTDSAEVRQQTIAGLQAIPSAFKGFKTT